MVLFSTLLWVFDIIQLVREVSLVEFAKIWYSLVPYSIIT